MIPIQNQISASDVFAIVQQISSQIDKDRIQSIADKANSLDLEEIQPIVDLLGMALEKHHHLLKKADCIMLLLSKVASSVGVFARNRTISSEHIVPEAEQSPDMYRILCEPLALVKVVKRRTKNTVEMLSEGFVAWAHLSHLNILPIYGVFLQGGDGPVSLVSPQMSKENIADHAKTLAQAARMPLISDMLDGLCYLHHFNIVHGALTPQNVLISHDGRALIAGPDSEISTARYSAPEILDDDDIPPKTPSNIWSLGCIIYEVLSGKVPFYQIRLEAKVGIAIATGKKPIRPDQEGNRAEEIADSIWRPLSTCWESGAKDRPSCIQLQGIFSNMVINDDRPMPSWAIPPRFFEHQNGPALNFDLARSGLMQIAGSDLSMPPPSKIPENFQKPLTGLIENDTRVEAVATAAKKLSPDDTQTLVDVLDLVWEEAPITQIIGSPIDALLAKIMGATHLIPQSYTISRIRYDPLPVAEGDFGKIHKGRDFEVCVSVVTNPNDISGIIEYLALWAHSAHANLLPFYGIFRESIDEISHFCLVSPYLKNGLLRDYAPRLPQRDRMPLILDVISGLVYLQGLNFMHDHVRGDRFLISDEGRVLVHGFADGDLLISPENIEAIRKSGTYALRFYAPEQVKKHKLSHEADIWSLGCLLYEVLSRRPPYYQYRRARKIRSALYQGEVPKRPMSVDDGVDEIDNQFWELIMRCCVSEPRKRLTLLEIQKLLQEMKIPDDRPKPTSLPGAEVLALRSSPDISWDGFKRLLDQIQVELLRTPLSKLIHNHTKDVAVAVALLNPEDTRTLVDFLDLALKNHITLSEERNRVLALLSRITTLTHIFPRRYELKGITYHPLPIAGGSFGTVHRGVSDPNICVKVMTKVDSKALMDFVKELILWAHASHPNVLSFYGVFVDEIERICLVSPYMNKGNLRDYAPRLAQKNRIPLLYDTIKGLVYLHGLGVVHTDLKGENVLISDEGRALITDFGASHVITATAKGGVATASVASTLRFTAPEIVLNRYSRPTQECDIWSFGCLCYEALSRKLPFHEYIFETQVVAALSRLQTPKRPSLAIDSTDEEDPDEFYEEDWDEIDDVAWSLIIRCCAPKPEDRPNASQVKELIVDLKLWDTRPEAKDAPDTYILSLRSNPEINLNRAAELLNELRVRLLAQNILRHATEDVLAAVGILGLDWDDATALVEFWDLLKVLKSHSFTSDEGSHALVLLSELIYSTGQLPRRYILPDTIRPDRVSIGSGSFGTAHRGSDPDLCVKVTELMVLDPDLHEQWHKALAPAINSIHPNILPFYGLFFRDTDHGSFGFLVSPFMKNGNLNNYACRLPHKSQMLLMLDIIEAVMYLHSLGIIHGNLKGENILISDEGRALVADFRPYHINAAATDYGPTGPHMTSTLRFTAPELVKDSWMLPTAKSDVWSIGCLMYLVLSQKVPFHQYSHDTEIRSALSRGELPLRPMSPEDGTVIDDQSWDLTTKLCVPEPDDRLMLLDVRKRLENIGIKYTCPVAKPLPGAEILKFREPYPDVYRRMGDILVRINSELPSVSEDIEREDEIPA